MHCNNNAIKCILLANFRVNFVHFIYHQFCTFHRSPKIVTWLAEQIRTFYPSLHESIILPLSLYDEVYTNRRVTTQVNTIQRVQHKLSRLQHKSDKNQHESVTIQQEFHRSQHTSDTNLSWLILFSISDIPFDMSSYSWAYLFVGNFIVLVYLIFSLSCSLLCHENFTV